LGGHPKKWKAGREEQALWEVEEQREKTYLEMAFLLRLLLLAT
jgi:hypothetical protein